jgi:hypothetical protein
MARIHWRKALTGAALAAAVLGAVAPGVAQVPEQFGAFVLSRTAVSPGATDLMPIVRGGKTFAGSAGALASLATSGPIVVGGTIVSAGASYQATASDYFICWKTGGAGTVTLPQSPVQWRTVLVKDCGGLAGTNPITVAPFAGTIDGSPSFTLNSNHQSIAATFDGMQWEIN